MRSHARQNLFGAACIAVQPLVLNALSIPVTAIIIRRLGPDYFGEWSISMALITTVSVVTNLGLRGAFVRTIAHDPNCAAKACAEQLGIRILLSLAAGILALISGAILGYSTIVLKCTAVAALGLTLSGVTSTGTDFFQASRQLPTIAAINLIAGLVVTGTSLVVVLCGMGPVQLMVAYQLGPIFTAIIVVCIIRKRHFPVHFSFNFRRHLELLKQSRFFALQQCVSVASTNSAALLLPKLIGAANFGYFAAGTLLPTRLAIVPDALGTAFYPAVARANRMSAAEGCHETIRCLKFMLLACIPTAIVGTLLASPIAHILFPSNSAICQRAMEITIWILPVMGIDCMMVYALNAVGKDVAPAKASVASGVVGVLMTVFLVIWAGFLGACWAMVFRYCFRIFFLLPCFLRTFFHSTRRMINIESPCPNPGTINSADAVRELPV